MVSLEDTVLGRLDEWFAKQISENYSNGLALETRSFFMSALRINPRDIEGSTSPEAASTILNFGRERFIAFYKNFFTIQYTLIKAAVSMVPVENIPPEDVGLKNEYIQPAISSIDQLTTFVERVRSLTEDKTAGQLTDNEIENDFIKVYPTPQHFTQNIIHMLDSADLAGELFRRFGINTGAKSAEYQKCEKAVKEWLPYLFSHLLGRVYLSRLPHEQFWTEGDVGRRIGFRAYDGTYREGTVTSVSASYGSIIDPTEIRNPIVFEPLDGSGNYDLVLKKADRRATKDEFRKQGDWCFLKG